MGAALGALPEDFHVMGSNTVRWWLFFFFFSPVWGKVSVFSSYLPESVLLSDLVAPVTRKARGFHEQPPWTPCRAGSGEQKVNQCL